MLIVHSIYSYTVLTISIIGYKDISARDSLVPWSKVHGGMEQDSSK